MSERTLQAGIDSVVAAQPDAEVFINGDGTEALVALSDGTIVNVDWEGNTSSTSTSWNTGWEC